MERACLATDVDGSRELISAAQNGILIPPGDPSALSTALVELATDAALRSRLGAAARATIEGGFDVTGMTRKIESLYLETLDNK